MLLYSLVLPMVRGLSLFLFPGVGEDRYTGPDTCGDGSDYRRNYRRVFEWPSGRGLCGRNGGRGNGGDCNGLYDCRDRWGCSIQRGECPEYVGNLAGKHIDGPFIIIVAAQGKSHHVVSRGNPCQVPRGGSIVNTVNEYVCPRW